MNCSSLDNNELKRKERVITIIILKLKQQRITRTKKNSTEKKITIPLIRTTGRE